MENMWKESKNTIDDDIKSASRVCHEYNKKPTIIAFLSDKTYNQLMSNGKINIKAQRERTRMIKK